MEQIKKLEQEINDLVTRLAEHQDALGLKNKEFAARYHQWLASSTTWMRLRQNKWQDILNHERIAEKLRDLTSRLDTARGFDAEAFIGELPFVTLMNAEYERLLGSRGDRRGIVALAPEGVGKSWWASGVNMDNGEENRRATAFYLRIRSTWKDKPLHLLRALGLVLGAGQEKSPAAQQESLVHHMRALGPVVVVLDEAHNGGVALFKILKDLIDETPARFVYLAFPTQYDEVRSRNGGAIAEARQFLRRCLKPIFDDYRAGIGARDVSSYLRARGFKDAGLEKFAEAYVPRLAVNYNLSTLADAVDEAEAEADDSRRTPSLADVGRALDSLMSTAAERRAAAAAKKEKK